MPRCAERKRKAVRLNKKLSAWSQPEDDGLPNWAMQSCLVYLTSLWFSRQWVGRVKALLNMIHVPVLQNERWKPRAWCQLSRKGEFFAALTQWFPSNSTHLQHNASLSFQMHLPLAGQTFYCQSDCLNSPGSSARCKKPSLPSQGPLLEICIAVFSATLCNGTLPRIASITLSSFMPCICKLLCLPFIFMVLLLHMWAFVWD